jgi:DNA-binding PadR family transcriptional regulator
MTAARTSTATMAIHHALLSLLDDGDSYGYELRAEFERTMGPQWGQLNIGHVYQLLERLQRDGLIEMVRCEPQPRRTERVIYAITDAGRDALHAWLTTPSPHRGGYRDDLHLKIVAGARAGEQVLMQVIANERQALLGELHSLRALGRGEHSPVTGLLIEGAALQTAAAIELLERAEEAVAELTQGFSESARPAQRPARKHRAA